MSVGLRKGRKVLLLAAAAATPSIRSSSSCHPSTASSTAYDLPPLSADDEGVVSSAVAILREFRSKRRWTFLKSVHHPSGFTPCQFSHVLLRLRNHPGLARGFFHFCRLHSLCDHDLLSFAAAAHVLARNRCRSDALSVLQVAVRSLDPSSSSDNDEEDVPPAIFRTLARTYRTFDSAPFVFDLLVQVYLEAKRLDRAIQVVRILRSRGIQPSIGISNALIRTVSRANGSDAGFQIYNQIFKTEAKVRVSPNLGTFNSLLLSLYREGNLEKSTHIREEMQSFGCEPNVFTYSILMAGFCDGGMMDNASRLWEEMVAKGIKPDIMAFNTLIGGYCGVEEMDNAEELYKQMTLSEIEPTLKTFEHLIVGHCRVGGIDSALLLYQDMKRRGLGLEVSVVDQLLAGMCQRGRVAEGLRILRDEMRREGFMPNQLCYEVLIRGLCREGEIEQALKLQAEMAGKGFANSIEVYSAFLEGYRKQGDLEKVEMLKDEMIAMGLTTGQNMEVVYSLHLEDHKTSPFALWNTLLIKLSHKNSY